MTLSLSNWALGQAAIPDGSPARPALAAISKNNLKYLEMSNWGLFG